MKKTIILIPVFLILSMLLVFTQVGRGLAQASSDAKIKSAMSAAPLSIAKDATILDFTGDTLRKGTNDWTCFPDNPGSPGNDPACYDKTWMAWVQALVTKTQPKTATAGFSYMLQGGSTASNTDPYAELPLSSDKWQADPPHIMVILPGKIDPKAYPTTMGTGGPYVMWAGTPYEHLMVPVAGMDMSK